MFAAAGTEFGSGLLLLLLTLFLLPFVLLPTLVAYVTAATGFRPFGTLELPAAGGLPSPDPTWLWGLVMIVAGWIAWRIERERSRRTAGATPVHADTGTRRPTPAGEVMVSVFGTPDLWSNVGHRWLRRRARKSKAQPAEESHLNHLNREGVESRSRRRGIEWNWRRPWTVVLSPSVQPQESPQAWEETGLDDGRAEGDTDGYEVEEAGAGQEGADVSADQGVIWEGEPGEECGEAGQMEDNPPLIAGALESYPAGDSREVEQPAQESFTIQVGARGFRSDR